MIVANNATKNTFGDGHWHPRDDAQTQLFRIDTNRQRIAVELGFEPGPAILPPEMQWVRNISEYFADEPSILFDK